MSEQEKEQTPAGGEPAKEQAQYTPSVQAEFMREKIKQKPVNKKKLLRRTVITAVMAVVFGLVACVTFLILEPVISNRLYPEEEPKEVVFPEETVTEEMKPEDMLVTEADEEEVPEPVDLEMVVDEQIEELLSQVEFGLEEYQGVYDELRRLTQDANRAVVTVAGVTSDVDWFNNIYENVASASGVIVANNERALLILVSSDSLSGADSIEVTFCDQNQVEAQIVQKDENTGLAILSVPLSSIAKETMEAISIAQLGSSNTSKLLGMPVAALGSPLGTAGSISYGVVTSTGTVMDMPDAAYKRITTDIYGSRNATGVLINLQGYVIGIIDNMNTSNDMGNLLTAYGITELKRMIEQMSNDRERAYLGVHGADVPKEAIEDAQIDTPAGAYIREIEIDSPAMEAGIQSGDIVVRLGDTEITTYNELLNVLYNAKPEDVLEVTLIRQGHEMRAEVTLGSWQTD
ncbi:MAG: S1C family serine protease [Bacteroidales bacterium]|nr:S1C family serine protease [Bacteroidales bacterium]MCM1414705.1 S1C family serine protease [bacterium]MCM1422514.1 S1C family serine protease [bacterium]